MIRDTLFCSLTALAGLLVLATVTRADLDEEQEKAIKAAVKKVGPTVVKIETSGGTEVVKAGPARPGAKGGPLLRRGQGPTTGVIVSPDGYVITSAFNFVNNPATIRVALPGLKERKVAKVVATDQTRMLTLLKLADMPADTKLPVAEALAKKDFQIGQTAVAVGRTLAEGDGLPSVSVGILSAVDRIWGKAVQTDAKVSPTNYGGPLIDLDGKVQGILVPASPHADGETAGFEWYDSGIGFAIPLEDIYAVLPRMKKGTDKEPVVLRRGFMGVTMKSLEMFDTEPVIGTVAPGSAGEKAGLKPDDIIKSIDGKDIDNYAQMLHKLGGRYEGDSVTIKVIRDKKEVEVAKIILGSAEAAFPQAFLGVLPLRDDPDPGVEIRYVYPKSGADSAGLKAGDRIMKVSPPQAAAPPPPKKKGGPPVPPTTLLPITRGRDQLANLLELARPGQELQVEVKRKAGGKSETVTVKLGEITDVVPKDKEVPETASAKKALTRPGEKAPPKAPPAKKPETGLLKKQTPAADNTYYVYVPDTYDPNVACSVLVWLHPPGKHKERDIEDFVSSWTTYCDDHNIMLLCPINDSPRGWTPGESDFIVQTVRTLAGDYTLDMRRVVTHGMGVGGEMALYLGFQARSLIHGVAPVGAALGSNPREKVVNQPLSFFLVVGAKDPVKESVVGTKDKLAKFKYPVVYREVANMGVEYIDGKAGVPTLEELVRWIDSLDRL